MSAIRRIGSLFGAVVLGVGIGFYVFDEPMRRFGEEQRARMEYDLTHEPEWKMAARAKEAAAATAAQQQQTR